MAQDAEIAVIGAGIIGLTIALRLAAEGREVVVIDPAAPGSGASYGNAGTIADYAVQPVGTPDVLRNLPSLLFDRNSPLSIRRAALPSLAPWLLRFARQSLPAAAQRNALAIAALMAEALPGWDDLAAQIGGESLMQRRGCLYIYETEAASRAANQDLAFRRDIGVAVEMLTQAELSVMEPGLRAMPGGAAFFPKAVFLADPVQMVALIEQAVRAAGVKFITAKVEQLQRRDGSVHLTGAGLQINARQVVIAAGAHSKDLARQAGDKVPLDTERGYHVEWDMAQPKLSRPCCPTSRGFYLCPMSGRLRVAGTVELGGLTAPPSPHRIAKLVEGARTIFPDLGLPDREWMGFRPSMPDSLPVIGASKGGAEVIHAYGHGHVGVTLAPITARIVADLVAGRAPGNVATPCRPTRF
ncbi:FAD-binding oxidoreductase [Pseudorhodobacter sp.]|uniref:NAD(P)/FAD-dependent oxidoreductase n=1 Tax=Pseudorhodobacter sp. TaxID=1934400 RepID=UPI002649B366|nr:FAD-dependent oxidoreductase [Pseudorhodobacter sp.]MDN5788441.1 FAD-binding oxidoreductase [Pseudorhodobacter sp.]